MKRSFFAILITGLVALNACKKDDNVVIPAPVLSPATGVYVLCEGGFGGNNATLAYRNVASGVVAADFYRQQNPTQTGGLGDLANDAIIYGSKLYIVMNGSGNVTVLNASTGVLLGKVSFINGSGNKSPRYAVGALGKVYVSSFDNTVSIIDTTSLAITGTINVGANPEGMATYGDYLYVANSGGLNPVFDSTVSVVDLNSNLEIKKITVGLNPQKIEVNSVGDVYVSGYGNAFSTPSIPPFISVISAATNTLKTNLGAAYAYDHIRIHNDTAYLYNNYGGGDCKVINTLNNLVIRNSFITDGTVIQTSYGINIDEQNGDVYITDAINFSSPGEVTCFNRNGVKKFSFSVSPGIIPNKVLFAR